MEVDTESVKLEQGQQQRLPLGLRSTPLILADALRPTARWLSINETYPYLRHVHVDPPLFVVENFLSAEECFALAEAGSPGLGRSVVVDAAGKLTAESRTSESCYLLKSQLGWLHARVAELTNTRIETHEPPQITRYRSTQQYLPHWDAFDVTTIPGAECLETGGQRVATVLIYLNDVAIGGSTFFPKLSLRFSPKQGTAVVFFPCTLDAELDPLALHTAEPAIGEHEKWVCQVWIRQFDFG